MLAALAVYEQERDMRQVGTSQRWLSRLSWLLGQNADSERYAAAAVSTLEPLEPGPELAMAYSNLAQLRMLAGEFKAVVRWGTQAIELARRLGDRDAEMHALNNVGTALASAGDMTEGCTRLTQSLDLALAEDAHEHAARAFTNLGSIHVLNWSLGEADRHLKAGITYCADRDLDTWRRYMSAWLARSLAGQGQYATAERHLADVLRHPHVSPITRVSALPVVGVIAARRGRDGTGPWTRPSRSPSRRGSPCAWCRWPRPAPRRRGSPGAPGDLAAEIDRAWDAAAAHPHPWELGELSWWLHLAGERRQARTPLARPFALMLAGEHRAAAAGWEGLGCPLWSAYALAFSPSSGTRSGAWTCSARSMSRPCATPCCATGALAACRCPAAPGRPAAPARPGSPPARPRCSSFSPTGCPTPRSRSGWCCPRRPWATTSRPSCASYGSPPGPGRSPRPSGWGSSRQDREHARCAVPAR